MKTNTNTGLLDVNGREILVGDIVKRAGLKDKDSAMATVKFGITSISVHIYAGYEKEVEYVGLYLDGLIGCDDFLPNSTTMLEVV